MEEQDSTESSINASDTRDHALIGQVDSALKAQASPAVAYVQRMRNKTPNLTPANILGKLERQLLAVTTTSGAAVGATAAAPGVGKAATAALTVGEKAVSVPFAVFYILAVAEVHQIPPADIEHRRKLALSILLAQGSETAIPKVAKRTGQHWARKTMNAIPGSALKPINNVLGENFVTKYGDKEGIIVLAKVIPYAMGAAIGGGYSFVTTYAIIRASRLAFGKPKPAFDLEDVVVDSGKPRPDRET